MNFADGERIPLWHPDLPECGLYCYLHGDGVVRPAMLVIPGGGYGCVCEETEGRPIAEKFRDMGFNAFVLHYRVMPADPFWPLRDARRAIRIIRSRAEEFAILPDKVAVCGFSAGAHLAGCTGVLDGKFPDPPDEYSGVSGKSDAMLLAYPVISFAEYSHPASGVNLLGKRFDELAGEFALDEQVTPASSPAYCWHTLTDEIVDYRGSVRMVGALNRAGVKASLHLFPTGPHGMQMGHGRCDISRWPDDALDFLREECAFPIPARNYPEKTVVFTFDDCVKNHYDFAAPLLEKYGFNATFFITRFSEEWRREHGATLMTPEEIADLHARGFEIGNHTMTHPDMSALDEAACLRELEAMERFLREECGIREPQVSFAYPGGPFVPAMAPVLKRKGIRIARTTVAECWRVGAHDPMQVPSISLSGDSLLTFYRTLANIPEGTAPVFLFHGVPELVHPWCNLAPELFARYCEYLKEHGFRVLSLRQYWEECTARRG